MKGFALDITTTISWTDKSASSTVCVELHKVSCCGNISVHLCVQVVKPVNKTIIWISSTQVIEKKYIVNEIFLYL